MNEDALNPSVDTRRLAALTADLESERRRAQALETQLLASKARIEALEQNASSERKKSDVDAAEAVRRLREMIRVNQFSTVRAVVRKENGFVGIRQIPIYWDKITPRSVMHVSACEAVVNEGDVAAGDYVGICGDAKVTILGAVCQTGVALVKVDLQWPAALSLMINVTLLGEPEQIIFCEPFDALRPLLPKETGKLRDEFVYNTIGFEDGEDDEFLEWAYARYLNRAIDEKAKSRLLDQMRRKGLTRQGVVKSLLQSKDYAKQHA
jgi:hypothetical protein